MQSDSTTKVLEKPIQNNSNAPYLDWIKSGKKTYEGRLKTKLKEWDLKIGKKIKFFDEKQPNSYVVVEITSLPCFSDFGSAFIILGEKLIPEKTKDEVVDLYNGLFHANQNLDQIKPGEPSEEIQKNGVVAIGFRVLECKP